MSEGAKYNGWTNYPTWNIKLWIDNDEHVYNFWRDRARKCAKKENPRAVLADELHEWCREQAVEAIPDANFLSDLLGYAVDSANFYEIAISMLEDLTEDKGDF